jgi:eukaryotic-like serine/threonine-protein kinase
MSESNPSENSSDDPMQSLIADFLDAEAQGKPLNRETWLARHASHAESLKDFLANHDRMKRSAPIALDDVTLPPSSLTQNDKTLPPDDDAATRSRAPAVGDRLRYFGDYELLEEIARGGMGVVYKARQINLNRIVALKMILSGQLASEQDIQRFRTEAESAANLDHPRIVPIYEVGQHAGQHYFSMGFVNGQSLAQKLIDGPMAPRDAVEMLIKICEGIAYAHERGVIHRDLKPANVLLDQNEQPKVTDFGLAKKLGSDSNLTGTGQILGTPSYMAPEQAGGRIDEVGKLADIYSLGAILYCLLTGRPPFQAANPLDTLLQVLDKEPIPPKQLNATIPVDLETICLKCLSKEPHRRYANANELSQELGRFLRGEPILARPVGKLEQSWRLCKRNPVVASLATAASFFLIAGSVVSIYFAFEADRRAQQAQQEEAKANIANELAQSSLAEAVEQKQIAEQARDVVETSLYFSNIKTIQSAWRANNLTESNRLLDSCPERLRNWEWHYLSRLHRLEVATIDQGKRALGFSQDLQFNADGSRLATFCDGNGVDFSDNNQSTIRIRDLSDLKAVKSFEFLAPSVTSISISADGKTIALGEKSGEVGIWDVETGKLLRSIGKLKGKVDSISLSPDGKYLAAARANQSNDETLLPIFKPTRDPELVVWNLETREEVFRPKGVGFQVKFSPDGSKLLTARENQTRLTAFNVEQVFTLFDVRDWRAQELQQPGEITAYCFDSSGNRLVATILNRFADRNYTEFVLFDTQSGKVAKSWRITLDVGRFAISPDGKTLAIISSYESPAIYLCSLKEGKVTKVLRGHTKSPNQIVFSSNSLLATTSQGDEVTLWNPTVDSEVISLQKSDDFIYNLASFAPSGTVTATTDNTVNLPLLGLGSITLREVGSKKTPRMINGPDGGTTALEFSQDGSLLAAGGPSGHVKVWSLPDCKEILSIKGKSPFVEAIAISPDRTLVASTSSIDGSIEIVVWNSTNGESLFSLKGSGSVTGMCFSPDGKTLLTQGSTVALWDLSQRKQIQEWEHGEASLPSGKPRFTPDGKYCISAEVSFADGSFMLLVRSIERSESVAVFRGHYTKNDIQLMVGDRAHGVAMAISPDGTRVVSAVKNEVILWELKSGREILRLPVSQEPDAERLASATQPLQNKFWPALSELIEAERSAYAARGVLALAWSPDGHFIRAQLANGTIIEWSGADRNSEMQTDSVQVKSTVR